MNLLLKTLMQVNSETLEGLKDRPDLTLAEYSRILAGLWATAIFFFMLQNKLGVMDLKKEIWLTAEELAEDMGILMGMGKDKVESVCGVTIH